MERRQAVDAARDLVAYFADRSKDPLDWLDERVPLQQNITKRALLSELLLKFSQEPKLCSNPMVTLVVQLRVPSEFDTLPFVGVMRFHEAVVALALRYANVGTRTRDYDANKSTWQICVKNYHSLAPKEKGSFSVDTSSIGRDLLAYAKEWAEACDPLPCADFIARYERDAVLAVKNTLVTLYDNRYSRYEFDELLKMRCNTSRTTNFTWSNAAARVIEDLAAEKKTKATTSTLPASVRADEAPDDNATPAPRKRAKRTKA